MAPEPSEDVLTESGAFLLLLPYRVLYIDLTR
jgi:hypothetical protein